MIVSLLKSRVQTKSVRGEREREKETEREQGLT